MIVETFKDKDEIYRRFREKGRMLPGGLKYLSSWTDAEFTRCFQLMETEDVRLFEEWTSRWNDVTDFEIIPVLTSEEAARTAGGEQE